GGWDELGGFDPALRLCREDVDFGWRANLAGYRVSVVPEAIVHHAEALTHRRREADATHKGFHRTDRQSAMHVLLANQPRWVLPWTYARLIVGSLVRALLLLLGKAPREAVEEIAALAAVLLRPDRIFSARRRRRAHRLVPARHI